MAGAGGAGVMRVGRLADPINSDGLRGGPVRHAPRGQEDSASDWVPWAITFPHDQSARAPTICKVMP